MISLNRGGMLALSRVLLKCWPGLSGASVFFSLTKGAILAYNRVKLPRASLTPNPMHNSIK